MLATPTRERALGALTVTLVLGLLALSGGQLWRLRQSKSEIRRLLARTPVQASDDIQRILRFARDPAEAQLGVARQLLSQAVAGAPGLEATIETLAEAAKRRRPSAFEAESVLGLARFLRLERSRDERLYKERAIWEAPLLRARALAPTEPEPLRALVRTRLRIWFALSDAERLETRELARASFLDRGFYYSVHARWLELNLADPQFALAALPVRPGAWLQAQYAYQAMKAWGPLLLARQRWYSVAERALGQDPALLPSAEEALDVLVHCPATLQLAPSASRWIEKLAIENHPGGQGLAAWWKWSIERTLAGQPALSAAAMGRLAAIFRDRPGPERAVAALGSGNLAHAEALESKSDGPGPLWDGYYLAKIDFLRARGEADKAASTLALLTGKDSLRAKLAAGQRPTPTNPGARGTTLLGHSSAGELDFETWLDAAASGFLVALSPRVGSIASLVEVSADGAAPEVALVTRSLEVRLHRSLAAGYHTLAVRTVFGEPPLVERVTSF